LDISWFSFFIKDIFYCTHVLTEEREGMGTKGRKEEERGVRDHGFV